MKFSIMHFCSQMSGFMDGCELWRVIERQFEGELTFSGRRVGPHPHDLPLLNYLARCQLPYPVLSAREKLKYSQGLPTRLYLPDHFGKCTTYKKNRRGDGFISAPLWVIFNGAALCCPRDRCQMCTRCGCAHVQPLEPISTASFNML